jgi:hypothetical protein
MDLLDSLGSEAGYLSRERRADSHGTEPDYLSGRGAKQIPRQDRFRLEEAGSTVRHPAGRGSIQGVLAAHGP